MNDTELQNVRRIQEKLLEILLYFQEFCEAHGLSFTLAGGTLLGAARNGGFVPWDDDADVFMLREDYEIVEGETVDAHRREIQRLEARLEGRKQP